MTNQQLNSNVNFDAVMDLPVMAYVQLGDLLTSNEEMSRVGLGFVLESRNQVQNGIQLKIGDSVVAMGELVTSEEENGVSYGLRITRVLCAAERAKA